MGIYIGETDPFGLTTVRRRLKASTPFACIDGGEIRTVGKVKARVFSCARTVFIYTLKKKINVKKKKNCSHQCQAVLMLHFPIIFLLCLNKTTKQCLQRVRKYGGNLGGSIFCFVSFCDCVCYASIYRFSPFRHSLLCCFAIAALLLRHIIHFSFTCFFLRFASHHFAICFFSRFVHFLFT